MTDSGTPPPRGDHSPIIPAAGRPASEGEIPRELFGFMRDASRELMELDSSVAQGGRRGPPYGREYDRWAHAAFPPAGIVRGETNTSLLPKAITGAQGAALPKVVVREDTEVDQDATLVDAAVLDIPGVGDELFVGGPEPADWVRLPDPRMAPTEPSLRRRVHAVPFVPPDAAALIGRDDRRRERLRNVVALSIGAFVAVVGLSSLLVTSLASEPSSVPTSSERARVIEEPARVIEAARTAAFPDDIPPPPALDPEPEQTRLADAQDVQERVLVAPAPALVPAVPPSHAATKAEPPAAAFGKPMAPASTPAGSKPARTVRVQSGLPRSTAAPSSASLSRPSSASSTQPKKRLWFPPE